MYKKGLSQFVTTLIFIAIGIVVIGGIWIAAQNVLREGSDKITLTPLTLDLKIESYSDDLLLSEGIFTILVKRNSGEGEISSINFILEDDETAEVYEEKVDNFPENAKQNFGLYLGDSSLDLGNFKISIAPTYYSSAGTDTSLGQIADEIIVEGLVGGTGGGNEEAGISCTPKTEGTDCPLDAWIGDLTCDATNSKVIQDRLNYFCDVNVCAFTRAPETRIYCQLQGQSCLDGPPANCIDDPVPCVDASDCGSETSTGPLFCSNLEGEGIYQNYITWACTNNICDSNTETRLETPCGVDEICFTEGDAVCVPSLECLEDNDCLTDIRFGIGYFCNAIYECELETPIGSGNINSAWPYGIGEYFDSVDLPQNNEYNPYGDYIVFPGSTETRCLRVLEFNDLAKIEGSIPYVRLNVSNSTISPGDNFEIWKTNYGCIA